MSSGSYRSNGNWGKKGVQFTLQDAERIAAAVQASERGRRGRKPSALPRAAGGSGGGGTIILEGTFVGPWPKGATKQVTISDVTAETSPFTAVTTVSVVNKIAYIMPAYENPTRTCYVLRLQANTNSWSLVNAEP